MSPFEISPVQPSDHEWIVPFLESRWGTTRMVSHGRVHHLDALPGFAARLGEQPVGLVTYRREGDACEITSLDSLVHGMGIGSALVSAVASHAAAEGCTRLWLITTNDNTPALRFYQKWGFVIAAVHVRALEESRRLKPEIPLTGVDGIPIRDEIELEVMLQPG